MDIREEPHDRLRESIVPVARHHMPGAGHMVAGDRNDRFTDAVVAFLSEAHEKPR